MKIATLIVDDEKKARENLRLLLEEYCPEIEIVGEAFDGPSIIEALESLQPALVFLDVQLGTTNIFDILEGREQLDFEVVFVTAHSEYAIQGYAYDAVDYLLKPISPEKLQVVFRKIRDRFETGAEKGKSVEALRQFLQTSNASPKIALSDSNGLHIVRLDEIMYCLGDGNYTKFFMKQGAPLMISKNLKYFSMKLEQYQFFRIHKSCLVNLESVEMVSKEDGGYVKMKDGKELGISRNRKKPLYEVLTNLWSI